MFDGWGFKLTILVGISRGMATLARLISITLVPVSSLKRPVTHSAIVVERGPHPVKCGIGSSPHLMNPLL